MLDQKGSFTDSIDVIGHELTHGVTQYTADLEYEYQSGALNESISDVFGSMIKQYFHPDGQQTADKADWLIGEGIFLPSLENAFALRSMKAPGTAYNNPLIGKDSQPATMVSLLSRFYEAEKTSCFQIAMYQITTNISPRMVMLTLPTPRPAILAESTLTLVYLIMLSILSQLL